MAGPAIQKIGPRAMKRYSKQDQRSMAVWAADCAERVLPVFENAHPNVSGPAKLSKRAGCGLIQACSGWLIYAEHLLPLMPSPVR
jgi:hypothetical protein